MILAASVDTAVSASFSWTAVAVAIALLVGNGFFVAAEISLLAARRTRVEEAAEAGDRRARHALKALRELSLTFSGAQLGITACSLGLGVVAEPAVAALFVDLLGASPLPAGVVPALSVVLALAVTVFLHMVLGDLAPKNLGLARPERVALALARPFGWFVTALRPLIHGLNWVGNALVRMVGVEPADENKLVHTPAELALVLAESHTVGTIEPQDARMMAAVLHLAAIDAEAAMTPRVDLEAVPDTATVQEVLDLAQETGHTRIPVYNGGIDHIVGLINVKDLLVRDDDELRASRVSQLQRPIPAVPESQDLERLLRDMLDNRSHAAVVVDEFGGTAGLLTLEDILEELVGEIADEFDEHDPVDVASDRVWVVPGITRRDEVRRTSGIELSGGEAETVSGWIVEQLGRLPEAGDRVLTVEGWQLTVLDLEGRRAGEVEIRAPEVRTIDAHAQPETSRFEGGEPIDGREP